MAGFLSPSRFFSYCIFCLFDFFVVVVNIRLLHTKAEVFQKGES